MIALQTMTEWFVLKLWNDAVLLILLTGATGDENTPGHITVKRAFIREYHLLPVPNLPVAEVDASIVPLDFILLNGYLRATRRW